MNISTNIILDTKSVSDIYGRFFVPAYQVLQLDRKTMNEKFASFLNETSMNKEQRRLIDLIIDFAIANGNITADDLTNTSPFDDIDFRIGNDVEPIIQIINAFNNSLHISA